MVNILMLELKMAMAVLGRKTISSIDPCLGRRFLWWVNTIPFMSPGAGGKCAPIPPGYSGCVSVNRHQLGSGTELLILFNASGVSVRLFSTSRLRPFVLGDAGQHHRSAVRKFGHERQVPTHCLHRLS
jgi:hypothetical protein